MFYERINSNKNSSYIKPVIKLYSLIGNSKTEMDYLFLLKWYNWQSDDAVSLLLYHKFINLLSQPVSPIK
jgi:hypothetical protein